MALQYGLNLSASDMRNMLEQNDKTQSGVRRWRQLFGNASLGFNAQSSALTSDYTKAVAEAYASSMKQSDAIAGAGLSRGLTNEMLTANRNDLHAAYETYIRNYGKDVSTLATDYSNEVSAINTALTERATNFANLYNSAYKYLSEELYGANRSVAGNAANGAVPIYDDDELIGYNPVELDYFKEHDMDWLLQKDELGNLTDKLRTWEDLSSELFNPDGSMTEQGIKFYDQMFNSVYEPYTHRDGERDVRGFDQWLSDTDNDLRNWWIDQDEYNYTFAGTNKGTANALTGHESTDMKYDKSEYANLSNFKEYTDKVFDATKAKEQNVKRIQALQAVQEKSGRAKEKAEGDVAGFTVTSEKAWQEYVQDFTSTKSRLDTSIKEKLGTANASTFWRENAELEEEYKQLIERASAVSIYDEGVTKAVDDWYKRLMASLDSFVKTHHYTGETSGF
jgi:hypothetical protein